MIDLHPELWLAHYMPSPPLDLWPSWVVNFTRTMKGGKIPPDIVIQDLLAPGWVSNSSNNGRDPSIKLRLYAPARSTSERLPALLWFHGGGYVIGGHLMAQDVHFERVRRLGIKIISVNYRLGPENAAPAGNDDAYAAWTYVMENAETLGIDPTKVVVGGQSAGGGMAAGLCQRIYDQGGFQPLSQYLLYPMLDDRTVLRADSIHFVWTTRNNHYGWKSYLGQEPGSTSEPVRYSVPARRKDLSGLAPTYISVGTIDLFHQEDEEYAKRLEKAGVRTRFEAVPGGFHGFEGLPWFGTTSVGIRYKESQMAALASAFKAFSNEN